MKHYVLQTDEEYREFLNAHKEEVRGLYYDVYYKNGGWNGLQGAVGEVERRYGITICDTIEQADIVNSVFSE